MIFIVCVRQAQHFYLHLQDLSFNGRTHSQTAKDANANKLALQMSRTGHHVRHTIVEEARAQIGEEDASTASNSGEPEPIPDTQEEYNAQADAALRDLFPRIPNTDRQMIIEHAFKKVSTRCSDKQESIVNFIVYRAEPFKDNQLWAWWGHYPFPDVCNSPS